MVRLFQPLSIHGLFRNAPDADVDKHLLEVKMKNLGVYGAGEGYISGAACFKEEENVA